MKTIYVNTDTYDVSMKEKDGYLPFETDLFNHFSDKDIEAQFYVPIGYTYEDPISGETYTGEYICTKASMPPLQNIAEIRNKAEQAVNTANAAQESTNQSAATLDDVMAALVELGDMVAALAEQPVTDTEVTDENVENTPVAEDGTAVAEEVIQNG